jgi:8-amino-7-oxononanoate synthase
MLDFLSSTYLGLRHGSAELGDWPALTTGRPAVLGGAFLADLAAKEVAALQGTEDAIAAASTLHLALDVFSGLLSGDAEIYWDAHLYPVVRAALCLAGGSAVMLPPHDPDALAARLAGGVSLPVLVTDGYCVGCGRVAPLAAYLTLLRPHRGILVVDDSQGLGVFGEPGPGAFGRGGGGTPAAQRVAGDPALLLLASLSKAFSTPMAVLSGPARLLDPVRAGLTRVHCSPPAVPAVRAAVQALHTNERCGASLRRQLSRSLYLFRAACRERGVPLSAGFHPVQTVLLSHDTHAQQLVSAAAAAGLMIAACRTSGAPSLRIVVTAAHTSQQIAAAAAILAIVIRHPRRRRRCIKTGQPDLADTRVPALARCLGISPAIPTAERRAACSRSA